MRAHTLSTLLLIAGIAFLLLGYFEPQIRASLATVVTDDTPPQWVLNSSGVPQLYPQDQGVYSATGIIQVIVKDPESGVTSVVATIDGTQYTLTLTAGNAFSGLWQCYCSQLDTGVHSLKYVATNGVGLQTIYTGSFEVATVIQGTWYVNGIEITNSTQTVYSSNLTVTFTFSRSSGPTAITCSVIEGSMSLLTLTSTDSSTWQGSYTFAGGAHTLALKASDGTTSVIMAMLDVNFGGIALNFTNEQLVMFAVGACCLGSGGYLRLPKKKRYFDKLNKKGISFPWIILIVIVLIVVAFYFYYAPQSFIGVVTFGGSLNKFTSTSMNYNNYRNAGVPDGAFFVVTRYGLPMFLGSDYYVFLVNAQGYITDLTPFGITWIAASPPVVATGTFVGQINAADVIYIIQNIAIQDKFQLDTISIKAEPL